MATPQDKTTNQLAVNRSEPPRKPRPAQSSQGSNITAGDQRFSARPPAGPTITTGAPRLLTEQKLAPKTFPVRLRLRRDGASSVCVAGSFNEWQPDRTPLRRDSEGAWKAELQLPPGEYEYRFVVDGEWTDDPQAGQQVANPFGGMNAVLRVQG